MIRPPETFATARLTARLPRPDDAPALFAAYASDPEVTRYLAWPPYTKVEPLADFLRDRAADWARTQSPHYAWLLCLRGTDTPIGTMFGNESVEPGTVRAPRRDGHLDRAFELDRLR